MDSHVIHAISTAKERRIALCQVVSHDGDKNKNVNQITAWMEKAARAGMELAVFGEKMLTGYKLIKGVEERVAEPQDGPSARLIADAAKRLAIAVIYGYVEVADSKLYNSLILIDKHGQQVANYRKVHVWNNEWEVNDARGDRVVVVDWEGIRIGFAVCADVCFPEFIRSMVAKGGAQLIVVAVALCDGTLYRKSPLVFAPARALENRCYVAYVCTAGDDYQGMTRMCDPFADCQVSADTSAETMLLATVPTNFYEKVPFHYIPFLRPEVYDFVAPYGTEVPWNRESVENVDEFFRNRAQYYDNQMQGIYNGPAISAKALAEVCQLKTGKVLDIAAGTGLIGQALFKQGFIDITALDRSKSMLQLAKKKNVYKEILTGPFDEIASDLENGSFLACVCVGAFMTAGFLDPLSTLDHMVRLTKTGGFILLLWNATELEEEHCQETNAKLRVAVETMTKGGCCKLIECRENVPKYLEDCEGKLFIFKKLSLA